MYSLPGAVGGWKCALKHTENRDKLQAISLKTRGLQAVLIFTCKYLRNLLFAVSQLPCL
jgi:hypothetical protein